MICTLRYVTFQNCRFTLFRGQTTHATTSQDCPKTTQNFLKLAKIKYYNNCIFHNVQKDMLAQSGDPTWSGNGGESVYAKMFGDQARYFEGEPREHLNHSKAGTVSMVVSGKLGKKSLHGSQFIITTADGQSHFDGELTVFGHVAEGMDVVAKINDAYADGDGRPYRNIRIKHVVILDDPFPDSNTLPVPPQSPIYVPLDHRREADDKTMQEENEGKSAAEMELEIAAKEALSRTKVLEMVGDIQNADEKPPDEILFVCKLHPVTQEDDLEIIFGRFGPVKKVEIIRDRKTKESLSYGFVEFETKEACIEAYTKMDNVLIDEKRIHVDFCQSVSKLWTNRVMGVPLPSNVASKSSGAHRKPRRERSRSRSRDRHRHGRRSRSRSRSKSRDSKKKHKKDRKKEKKRH